MDKDSTWQARIPADIDRPEPLLWNLTAHQLLVIGPVLFACWGLFTAAFGRLPLWSLITMMVVLVGCAWVLACGRRDGIGLDQMALLALRWRALPRQRHPDNAAPHIDRDGVLDLGGRSALILTCTSVPFHLFSGEEQDQVLGTFAGFLDSLTEPVQIIVQRRWMDPTPHILRLRTRAEQHPGPLRRAASAHARFLEDLQHHHDLVHHRVLLVLTAHGSPAEAGEMLLRRAEDTVSQLAALDITARPCDGPEAEQIITHSLRTAHEPTTPQED